MKFLFFALGSFVILGLSACASSNGNLQSRIERKVDNPESQNVNIGTEHYNAYSRGFEAPWPYGPYSN
jgi:hypothetical protein